MRLDGAWDQCFALVYITTHLIAVLMFDYELRSNEVELVTVQMVIVTKVRNDFEWRGIWGPKEG
jgi:hypothetical protein